MKNIRKTIKVTAKDIKHGIRSNGELCPLALAVARRGIKPMVHDSVSIDTECEWILLPRYKDKVERFILRFDKGKQCKPFKFVIKLDHEVI